MNVDIGNLSTLMGNIDVKKDRTPVSSHAVVEYEHFLQFATDVAWTFDENRIAERLGTATQIKRMCKVKAKDISEGFLSGSKPVVVTDAQQKWEARLRWSCEWFAKTYPKSPVIINDRAPARKHDSKVGRPQNTVRDVPLADYVKYLKSKEKGSPDPPFYLNGWHAFKHHPDLLDDISYPDSLYFVEDHTRDTLTEIDKVLSRRGGKLPQPQWVHNTDVLLNKIFVSPEGCVTRLHFDAHQSHAWLAQIQGRKLFLLFPPKDTQYLYPLEGEQTVQSPVDPLRPDLKMYPNYRKCSLHCVVLEEGETILVPEGWWHYAVSLEKSITVMRNFYNAHTNVNGLVELFATNYKNARQKQHVGM